MSYSAVLTAKLKQISAMIDVEEFYASDTAEKPDAYNTVREVFLMMSALAEKAVVDELNAVTLEVDPPAALRLLTHRWTPHEALTPAQSWRRWPAERLARFIVQGLAKVVPPFWWSLDYDAALTTAARVIDGHRHEGLDIDGAPHVINCDTLQLVDEISWETISAGERRPPD